MKVIKGNIGDTITIKLTVLDEDKVAIDISSGYTSASLKIAKTLNIADDDALYYESVLAANFSDGANGIHSFVISEDVTKLWKAREYMYQLRLIDSSNVVSSSEIAQITIKQNLLDIEV